MTKGDFGVEVGTQKVSRESGRERAGQKSAEQWKGPTFALGTRQCK